MDTCVLCNDDLSNGQETVTLREKVCEGVNKASTERNDVIVVVPVQILHKQC